jgi:hypothetical protein
MCVKFKVFLMLYYSLVCLFMQTDNLIVVNVQKFYVKIYSKLNVANLRQDTPRSF